MTWLDSYGINISLLILYYRLSKIATSSNIIQHQNLEILTPIWLDSLVNSSQNNIDTKVLLRKAINRLKKCQDCNKCIEYIRHLSRERVVLIVSGRLGEEIVLIIHHFSQLIGIYVYCSDKKRNEEWANKLLRVNFKIKNLFIF